MQKQNLEEIRVLSEKNQQQQDKIIEILQNK